jgi:hypothetical protein
VRHACTRHRVEAGAAGDVRVALVLRGHQVFTCHADGADDFTCAGVHDVGACPLDLGMVDVVVDVRDEDNEFTTREYGVVCARRADVPVVIAGPTLPVSSGATFPVVAVHCGPDDVSEAVESAAALPDVAALSSLRTGLHEVIARHTGEQRAVVSIVDHGFYVDVVVRSPATLHKSMMLELERVARTTLRPHRPDWAHTRLVYRQTPMQGATPYDA